MFMNGLLFAQTAPSPAGAGGGLTQILMMVAIFVIFYLVLILPESRRRKKLQKEISAIKLGDKVVTSGGIFGTVDFVGEKTFYVKSVDAKFEIAKESITAVVKNK